MGSAIDSLTWKPNSSVDAGSCSGHSPPLTDDRNLLSTFTNARREAGSDGGGGVSTTGDLQMALTAEER